MKQDNRDMSSRPSNLAPAKPAASSVAVVAEALKDAILRGDYGMDQRLIEADISAQYNASRFTVRAAIQELAGEGLVVVQRNKGARVRALTRDEAIENTQVRMVVEGLAAAIAAQKVSADQTVELEEIGVLMKRAVAKGEPTRYSQLNSNLHVLIGDIAQHNSASRILAQLRAQMARYQLMLSLQPGRSEISLPQHERIIDAIVKRDPVEAENAMRNHIASVIEALRTL